jgi:hypothetical protein
MNGITALCFWPWHGIMLKLKFNLFFKSQVAAVIKNDDSILQCLHLIWCLVAVNCSPAKHSLSEGS